jgi:hypothetical protein
MSWYAAHIIMAVKLKDARQDRFPVWENVVLVEGASDAEAFAKAKQIGRRDEGDDDGTFRWGGQPATWVFVGVRKLTDCVVDGARPGDGDEITYTELELDSQEAVKQLAAGKPVVVRYRDRYRALQPAARAKPTKRANRKRA